MSSGNPSPAGHRRPGPKAYLLICLFALLLVLFPFLFWYYTWFGRKLSDTDIDQYFADKAKPRHAQHALVQVGERMGRHENVTRWYPQIIQQASSPSLELRETAAWIMGQDWNHYVPFHDALLRMIHDPQPMVRRNAALALTTFADPAARPELVAMLRPSSMAAPVAGTVKYRLKLGEYVNPGTLVAHIGETEVRSAVPGTVRDLEAAEGAHVKAGDPLLTLSADPRHVWEALCALYLVGDPSDLEDVQNFTRPNPEISPKIVQQATQTADAIRARGGAPPNPIQ